MALNPTDEKLRLEQLRVLRRKWLKDQELSPREPVLPPTKQGPVERFWSNFLREKSFWRTYVCDQQGGLTGVVEGIRNVIGLPASL